MLFTCGHTGSTMLRRGFYRSLARLAVLVLRGSVVLALTTLVAYRLHLNSATAGFLYLVGVVLNGLDSGFPAAAIVSVLAVACLRPYAQDLTCVRSAERAPHL